MGWYGGWRPYVPVAQRQAKAARFAQNLAKKEKRKLAPVTVTGRQIATTFWGRAWMENLERYSDFENRLPRGRTYVRNGSVIDLVIDRGLIKAIVSGSEIYQVRVTISTLGAKHWKQIKGDCAQSINSLIDLLSGTFDEGVMRRLTQPQDGLFPHPKEIQMQCSCPDWATLCKHVAAVMYGVGARLDAKPELLFTLRDVDHADLVRQATAGKNLDRMLATSSGSALGTEDLGAMFGIELETSEPPTKGKRRAKSPAVQSPPPGKTSNRASRSARRDTSTATSPPSKSATRRRRTIATSSQQDNSATNVSNALKTKKPSRTPSSTGKANAKPVLPLSKTALRVAKPRRKSKRS